MSLAPTKATTFAKLRDRCYSSHLRRKFLEKEGTVTLDDLLRIARSQEVVDRQLKQYTDQVDQNQVNGVNGKGDGNKTHRKGKTCFSCGQEGHFSQDKKCPARGQKLAGSAVERVISKLNALNFISVAVGIRDREERRIAGVDKAGEARVPVDPVEVEVNDGGRREANLVTGDFATSVNPHSPDYAFSVDQLNGRELQRRPLVTLVIGDVDVPDVLIDS